jgi:hypothetical protein
MVCVEVMSKPDGELEAMRTVTVSATVSVRNTVPTPFESDTEPAPSAWPVTVTDTVTDVSDVGSPFVSSALMVMKLAVPTVRVLGEGVSNTILAAGKAAGDRETCE